MVKVKYHRENNNTSPPPLNNQNDFQNSFQIRSNKTRRNGNKFNKKENNNSHFKNYLKQNSYTTKEQKSNEMKKFVTFFCEINAPA